MDFQTTSPNARASDNTQRHFGLSRQEATLKTDLMAQLWIAHAALCDCLDKLALLVTGHETALRDARAAYLEAIQTISEFASAAASKQRTAIRKRPLKWHSTPEAEAVRFWVGAYADLSETFASLPSAKDLGYPDADLLTAFEELSDCP
jgi:hypothetical protein